MFSEAKQKQLDMVFMKMAKEMATLSHCQSFKVACLIVKDGRILSTGINGTPTGATNCDEIFPPRESDKFNRDEHHTFSDNYEIHSEINAIIFAAKNGIAIDGATMYCTLSPCKNCLKAICNSGVKRIVYGETYDMAGYEDMTVKMLAAAKIKIEQLQIGGK